MEFLPSLAVLAAFTAASLILVATPGPDMTLFLGKTLTGGRDAGLAAMLGAMTGTLFHTLLAAFGLSALLAGSAAAFNLLKMAGAAYLLWLAYDALTRGSSFTLERAGPAGERLGQVFMKGVGINLLNPKIVLFFVTFLPQFVAAGDSHAAGKLMFLGLYFIALALPLCAAMVLMAEGIARRLQSSPRATRIIDCLFAGIFAAFAIRLLLAPSRG